MMPDLDPKTLLTWVVSCLGVGAAVWSTTMLIGGFEQTGQLATYANPIKEGVLYLASLVIISAVGVWFYCLSYAERIPLRVTIVSGVIVVILTLFSSFIQLYLAVDGSQGESIERYATTEVEAVWAEIDNTDREIINAYTAKIDFYEARMREEQATGRGERFRQSREEFNRLRETYGPILGVPLGRIPNEQSLTDNIASARAAISALRAKVETFERFAAQEGLGSPRLIARLDALVERLDSAGGESGGWIDQRTLVYREVLRKLGEMIESRGTADPAFTLSVTIALIPDMIQFLCALMLYILRSDGPSILARRIHETTSAFSLKNGGNPRESCGEDPCRSKMEDKERFSIRTGKRK